MRIALIIFLILYTFILSGQTTIDTTMQKKSNRASDEQEWKNILTPEQYEVMRKCATEPPFTGKYYQHKEQGTYHCAACGAVLFSSDTKYDSGSGWPSFYKAVNPEAITEIPDDRYGMRRIEIKCAACGSHLGHVFPDGPQPTGLRYCVNSVSLEFTGNGHKENDRP
jgi:peptide-methionine (R)-S-oxide reductase